MKMKIKLPDLEAIEWIIIVVVALILLSIPLSFNRQQKFVAEQIEKCEAMGGFAVTDSLKTEFKNCAFKVER